MHGYSGDSISSECERDLEEQIKYLGPSHFLVYTNNEKISQNEYGEDSIMQFSEI